jgi:RNA polymerase sigma-70 factor (ECF subfamily)
VEDPNKLMERVRSGDADAFEALYDGYHRLVYGLALRALSDPLLAEDVTQLVFLKIWRSPESFREGNFTGWIARVSRNQALDVLRARRLRAEEELPQTLPVEEALEDEALARVDAALVRQAMTQLPEREREVIELGFFGGVTHHEMARRTGVPLGTVKTRIRTGLRRLRSALELLVTA